MIPESSKYPQAAAIMHPTRRPPMTLQDFKIGDPKRSRRRIVTKTENPRPMYSALPKGRACLAKIFGHFAKNSDGLASEQGPDPPTQALKPALPTNSIPISMTVGPVTMGGNIFFNTLGGRKLNAISRRAQTAAVPMRAPYASGQGRGLPVASTLQNPFLYIWAKAPLATGMIAKDVPTTEISPVPM